VPGIAPVLMKAGAVGEPGPPDDRPLVEVTRPVPRPRLAQARTMVETRGVRRTHPCLAPTFTGLAGDGDVRFIRLLLFRTARK
jgi:hypothetical protein